MTTPCTHPAHRLYAAHTYNLMTDRDDWLSVTCCACGDVLTGSADDYEVAYAAHLAKEPTR